MENQDIIAKTREALSPFETENIVKFVKQLSFSTIIGNPWVVAILLIVFFFAIIKRSKPVLLFLFTLLSLICLIHYTMPESGDVTWSSLLPLVGGSLVIGSVLIYFIFIKSE